MIVNIRSSMHVDGHDEEWPGEWVSEFLAQAEQNFPTGDQVSLSELPPTDRKGKRIAPFATGWKHPGGVVLLRKGGNIK